MKTNLSTLLHALIAALVTAASFTACAPQPFAEPPSATPAAMSASPRNEANLNNYYFDASNVVAALEDTEIAAFEMVWRLRDPATDEVIDESEDSGLYVSSFQANARRALKLELEICWRGSLFDSCDIQVMYAQGDGGVDLGDENSSGDEAWDDSTTKAHRRNIRFDKPPRMLAWPDDDPTPYDVPKLFRGIQIDISVAIEDEAGVVRPSIPTTGAPKAVRAYSL